MKLHRIPECLIVSFVLSLLATDGIAACADFAEPECWDGVEDNGTMEPLDMAFRAQYFAYASGVLNTTEFLLFYLSGYNSADAPTQGKVREQLVDIYECVSQTMPGPVAEWMKEDLDKSESADNVMNQIIAAAMARCKSRE